MVSLDPVTFALKRAYWFVYDNWKGIAVFAGVCLAFVAMLVIFRGCNKQEPLYTPDKVQELNSASASERRAEFQKTAEQNAGVVRTADNTMTIADVNVVERNTKIAETVAKAEAVTQAAKMQGRDVTQSELQCALVPTDCQ